MIAPLGLVATGKRRIKSGVAYEKYFDLSELEGTNPVEYRDGNNFDTLSLMERHARNYAHQTEKIAEHLRDKSLKKSLQNLWDFLYNHVQYKLDSKRAEQVRTPIRTWKDRATGVDCDCYATFIGSVLVNWSIPFAYRMAGYKKDFQHVYVVVPVDGKQSSLKDNYYTIDPVVDQFNYEVPFSKQHDRFVAMQIQTLNGTDSCNNTGSGAYAWYTPEKPLLREGYIITEEWLKSKNIPYAAVDGGQYMVYTVETVKGYLDVPYILTPEQAQQLTAILGPAPKDNCHHGDEKKFPWGKFLAIAGVSLLALRIVFGGGKGKQNMSGVPTPSPSPVPEPVAGTPKKTKTYKRRQKSMAI